MFDQAAPEKSRHSISLIRQGLLTRTAVISFQVVQEFFSVAFRRLNPIMTKAEAEQFLAMTLRPLMVVQSSYGLYAKALQLNGNNSLSWFDALIVAAALEANCRILYTEDLQHGQKFSELRVVNPFL
jgi:predicted nucleic acid-binding protein